jgi:hypothetical protein
VQALALHGSCSILAAQAQPAQLRYTSTFRGRVSLHVLLLECSACFTSTGDACRHSSSGGNSSSEAAHNANKEWRMSHLALCKQYSNKMKHNAAVLQILQQ